MSVNDILHPLGQKTLAPWQLGIDLQVGTAAVKTVHISVRDTMCSQAGRGCVPASTGSEKVLS